MRLPAAAAGRRGRARAPGRRRGRAPVRPLSDLDLDLVEQRLEVGPWELSLLRPRQADALIDEEAFEHEEFLPYWAELWASGLALAEEVAGRDVSGLRVLELGCGLGLPSLAAALVGADVLATDWSADAVALLRANAAAAGVRLAARRFSWTAPGSSLGPPWPLVLAADVLYERRNGAQLLAALPVLVAPDGAAWIADPGRASAAPFWAAAAADWVVEVVAADVPVGRSVVTVRRLVRRAAGRRG